MSDLQFAIEIGARDKTQGGLKAALASVTGFARGAMGAMRDFNLGLRPAIAGMGQLIQRGGELEVISKAFRGLTYGMVGGSDALAKKLVNASSGVLKLSEAMAIANRALGSGMKLNDVATAIEFIGKKSIATGKDAKTALDTVITGLSRGSTLFLDDFGILVDGLDGVKRKFGKGFDSLGPAAQKAEIIRQAIAEMNGQLGRIGVTGREASFVFAGMSAQIGDAMDKLSLAFVKSQSVLGAMTKTRDLMRGMGLHFEKGGSIEDVLFGKKGGKSGGLAGIAAAALGDVGKNLGHGIAGALFGALGEGAGALEQLFTVAENHGKKVIGVWESEGVKALGRFRDEVKKLTSLLPSWPGGGGATSRPAATSQPAAVAADRLGILGSGLGAVPGAIPGQLAHAATREALQLGLPAAAGKAHSILSKQIAKELVEQQNLRRISSVTADSFGTQTIAKIPGQPWQSKAGMLGLKGIAKLGGPLLALADFGFSLSKFVDEALGLQKDLNALDDAEARAKQARIRLKGMRPQAALPMNPLHAAGVFGLQAAIGAIPGGGGLSGKFSELAKAQFGKLGFGNTRAQFNGFLGDFSQTDPQRAAAAAAVGAMADRLPMSKAARANAERQRAIARRNAGIISQGGFGINVAARKEATEGLAQLRRSGRDLSDPTTRRRVFNELAEGARRRMIRERMHGTEDRPGPASDVQRINRMLVKDNQQRYANRADVRRDEVAREDMKELVGVLKNQAAAVEGLVERIGALFGVLAGETARIKAVAFG